MSHGGPSIPGIYVGGSKVVHFTRKKEAGTAGLDSAIAVSSLLSQGPDGCPTFPDCGFQRPGSGVVLTCLDCFLRGGALHRFEYGAPPAVFLAKLRGGICTTEATTMASGAAAMWPPPLPCCSRPRRTCEDLSL